ncbi:MAG TPA: DEAD/DEAH box helicase family protein, partial [Vicinamibacterales bacterium]|nr:DEAD/DEAH box helicase family protein [Vicinamibacterales bacterium]
MARRTRKSVKQSHAFRNKLVLNQWMMSLLGVDPLIEHRLNGRVVRPWHVLVEPIRDPRMEGLDESNIHRFFHNLIGGRLFEHARIDKLRLLRYEENIVGHTQRINERRTRPITWKYPQWLTLLFVEIYLDRYFSDRAGLLHDLNEFVERFNQKWHEYEPVPPYVEDDLNKLCFQNATGSGKTLIMHVNLLQFQHYARQAGRDNDLSRVILLTPNERLSEQHQGEFQASGISVERFVGGRSTLFTQEARGLGRVDVLEITKLADQDGPQQIATRSLGDQNLLLVDEGHRGMSGKEEGAWVTRRNALCAKGFTFEYSATFAEAVAAAKDERVENAYAKAILFDYSYRYFYEDGFGKDYQILNLSKSFEHTQTIYLTACLLKFYQQLRIYEERRVEFAPFNLEKPLWVFVGSSVVKATGSEDEKAVASDVAKVLRFVADFLRDPAAARQRIGQIITGTGQDTGLLDEDGNDIFSGSFGFLARALGAGEAVDGLYQDVLRRLFNNPAGGTLVLSRIKGDSGEIALKAGAAEHPFGLINVGDAAGLAKHCEEVLDGLIQIEDSEFTQAMFAGVKDSGSPVNLLIGSKKFIEGWDCWRVSTMGLMHVGKSEGAQIIQLFGRGVRLKGYDWTLKRSGHTFAPSRPQFIEELETLNIFGIEADFMQRFRDFLKEEGLPGNERMAVFTVPLLVTHDFGKKLKILRPKIKTSDGREYDFKRDGRVPTLGDVPDHLQHSTVVSDWYPRIQAVTSRENVDAAAKATGTLHAPHLAVLDYDALYFELERFKRERSWFNLNIPRESIRALLADPTWYRLYIPPARLQPNGWG